MIMEAYLFCKQKAGVRFSYSPPIDRKLSLEELKEFKFETINDLTLAGKYSYDTITTAPTSGTFTGTFTINNTFKFYENLWGRGEAENASVRKTDIRGFKSLRSLPFLIRLNIKLNRPFSFVPKDFGFPFPEIKRIYVKKCPDHLGGTDIAHTHTDNYDIVCARDAGFLINDDGSPHDCMWHEYGHVLRKAPYHDKKFRDIVIGFGKPNAAATEVEVENENTLTYKGKTW